MDDLVTKAGKDNLHEINYSAYRVLRCLSSDSSSTEVKKGSPLGQSGRPIFVWIFGARVKSGMMQDQIRDAFGNTGKDPLKYNLSACQDHIQQWQPMSGKR